MKTKNTRQSKTIQDRYRADAKLVLYYGDANKFLRTIPDNSVSLIITSPPYNLGKEYERRTGLIDYLGTQLPIISELYRVLRNDGSICWQVGTYIKKGEVYPLDILYYNIFKQFNLSLRNRIVWHYRHGLHASQRFSGRYETILWFTKSNKYTFNLDPVRVPSKYPGKRYYKGPRKGKPSGNPGGKNPSDIWEILAQDWETAFWDIPNVKANHPEKTIQPCQFPVELAERCVLALTNKGDWVLDPFAGAGSSLIAAAMHDRRAMGSEKEKKYYQVIVDRLHSLMRGDIKLRLLGTPVYAPTGKEKVARIPNEWKIKNRRR